MPAPIYPGDGAYPQSYYAATAHAAPHRPPLQGPVDTEVCVVGAGYSGLSTALHLAEKGHRVVLIEGAQVGWGASGRNGGQIVNGLNASLAKIGARYGDATQAFVAGLVLEGGDIIRERVARYDIQCDIKPGNVFAAITAPHLRDLEAMQTLWRRYGMENLELLDRQAMRGHIGSDRYIGGMIDHRGGHMHPLNLALGEAAAFEGQGGVIHEHSPVLSVDTEATRPVVRTAQGSVTCDKLVLCGNAYLGGVSPQLSRRVMPVSSQMMATAPLTEAQAQAVLPSDACVEDMRYILDYFRLSADKRLIFGGGVGYGGGDPRDIEGMLRRNMAEVFPELAQIKVDHVWSGQFALSFSRVPQMGRLGRNVYFAQGYSGHGITGSHMFGRILAEAVHGDTARFDTFAAIPWYPFPGGRLCRVPYTMIGAWWYALRDRLGV
ncbi:NAD(P)/FAD-dependent oxidoreductase [Phaeovulum sp. W22_SRMD_FR3]|uniref:NAD(P)/FAD-dependent oxidoreductase n=1 Tax=Phaeovulum sp. W22_SRMD_FR3 TaxID=3240274 RepID=UPI003F9D6BA6